MEIQPHRLAGKKRKPHCLIYEAAPYGPVRGRTLGQLLKDFGWTVSHHDIPPPESNSGHRPRPEAGIIHVHHLDRTFTKTLEELIRTYPHLYWVVMAPLAVFNREKLGALADSRCFFLPVDDKPPTELSRKLLELVEQSYLQWQVRAPLSKGQYLEQHGILGNSPAVQHILRQINKMAGADASVLVTGETGSGKELVAQALHRLSTRSNGPFMAVNCGAIAPNLVQSELFGHEAGAFTGATRRHLGMLERAHGGTLFLDEIGELPMEQQANLLRFLQDKTFHRVGGEQSHSVNARIIAATHIDLDGAVARKQFREDLYFRLAVLQIHVPPLRERLEDMELLAGHFLQRFAGDRVAALPSFSERALAAMRAHHWPGNIRELMNRVQRAAVMFQGALLEPEDLGLEQTQATGASAITAPLLFECGNSSETDGNLEGAKTRAEAEALLHALAESQYHQGQPPPGDLTGQHVPADGQAQYFQKPLLTAGPNKQPRAGLLLIHPGAASTLAPYRLRHSK